MSWGQYRVLSAYQITGSACLTSRKEDLVYFADNKLLVLKLDKVTRATVIIENIKSFCDIEVNLNFVFILAINISLQLHRRLKNLALLALKFELIIKVVGLYSGKNNEIWTTMNIHVPNKLTEKS